jgi:hypothetical protein
MWGRVSDPSRRSEAPWRPEPHHGATKSQRKSVKKFQGREQSRPFCSALPPVILSGAERSANANRPAESKDPSQRRRAPIRVHALLPELIDRTHNRSITITVWLTAFGIYKAPGELLKVRRADGADRSF